MSVNLKGRSFLTLLDFSPEEIRYLLDLAHELKAKKKAGIIGDSLRGKNVVLMFEKTSTRTRCSFEVAIHDEGGHVTYLDSGSSQVGKKESIEDTAKVLYGGPMMGLAVASEDMVITKNNNGLLAFSETEARLPEPGACIRCGNCLDVCPMALAPALMEKAVLRKDLAQLEKLDLMNCMECGCCAYGCPAYRPLVQTFRLGKSLLKEKKK